MKDLLISVDCDYTYHIRTRNKQTDYNYIDYDDPLFLDPEDKTKKRRLNYLKKALTVKDPTTCALKYDLERWV